MRVRFARGRLTLAVVLAAAALVATPATAARCPTHAVLDDLWIKIPGPNLTSAGVLTGYDAADGALGHLVATNGVDIGASDDGGCTWTQAALPEDAPVPPLALGEMKIVGQSLGQARFAMFSSTVVWAIGQTDVANEDLAATQPRVLYSTNGGKSFASRIGGLPQFGRPVAIRGYGQSAVLIFKATVPTTEYQIFATGDAGETWTRLWSTYPVPALSDLALDPLAGVSNPDIWLWSSTGLLRGRPRDAAPKPVVDVLGPVRTVDLGWDSAGRRSVTAYITNGVERFVTVDGGVTFAAVPAPEGVQSATNHPRFPGLTAVSSIQANVLVEPPPPFAGPLDFSPREDNVSDVQFVGTLEKQGFPLYAFNPLSIFLRYVPVDFKLPPPPREPPLPPVDVEVRRPKPAPPPKASITPAHRVVTLRPGERRTIGYEVTLPPVPTPLDVFFMTDSTGSMSRAIASVQEGVQDIVDALAVTGIDVEFGVADFRDYPEDPTESNEGPNGNYPYFRRRPIGPIGTQLEDALQSLTAGGGTPDGDDSALEAIYQAATGAGRTDPLGVRGQLIPAGEGAEFRDGSMKVILLASDDGMRHPDATNPTYPGPSLPVVREALVENDIYLVGIEVKTSSGDSPREELELLAAATGATAPRAGVDCDGDNSPDLYSGEPIVCEFESKGGGAIADAFIAMLSGLEDIQAVDLTITGGRRPLVRPKAALHHPAVNVKAPNTFKLPVEFHCTPKDYGSETLVRIGAHSRGEQIVSTTALVVCESPDPPPSLVVPPAVAVAFVPPPPPPPAPIPNAQPNVNPNLNPNPNPQLNTNAGFAAQEEQQLQLALADQGVIPEEDLAMTGLDRAGPPMPAVAWATAFAMTGAAAFGLHLRRRTAPAPAFNPRSHR